MLRHCDFIQRSGAVFILLFASTLVLASDLVLRDESFAKTAEGRQYLNYLVSCALPEDITVVVEVEQQRYRFPGLMGLAPQWSKQPLTLTEQRRVSSCLFARTNFFGKPVIISLRSDVSTMPDSVKANRRERKEFPFFEAGFFGNIFLEQPQAFVCSPTLTPKRQEHLASLFRVCSFPAQVGDLGYQDPTGKDAKAPALSRCHFIQVGTCDRRHFKQNGVDYTADVLKVYLPGPVKTQ